MNQLRMRRPLSGLQTFQKQCVSTFVSSYFKCGGLSDVLNVAWLDLRNRQHGIIAVKLEQERRVVIQSLVIEAKKQIRHLETNNASTNAADKISLACLTSASVRLLLTIWQFISRQTQYSPKLENSDN